MLTSAVSRLLIKVRGATMLGLTRLPAMWPESRMTSEYYNILYVYTYIYIYIYIYIHIHIYIPISLFISLSISLSLYLSLSLSLYIYIHIGHQHAPLLHGARLPGPVLRLQLRALDVRPPRGRTICCYIVV